MTRIDSHQHFWALERADYGWLTPSLTPLYRDYGPEDLRPLLDRGDIDASILIQAAPSEAETQYLLDLADLHDWILGVVGWVDLEASDAPARIAVLAARTKLVGVRPMLQDMTERAWILRSELGDSINALVKQGLAFDALIRPDQIGVINALAERHPDLPIIVDHAGKPAIGADISAWEAAMRLLAERPNVHVKLSGLVNELVPGADIDALRSVVDLLLSAFGSGRILWGSDWPVLNLVANYGEWLTLSETLLADLAPSARAALFGGNAARFYGCRT
jgi:L-fuconolactonase